MFRIQGQVVQDAKPAEAAPPLLPQEATTGTASASVIARGIDTTEIVIGIVREIAGGHARRLREAGTTPTGAIRSVSRAKVRRGRRCDRIRRMANGTPRRPLLRCTEVPNSGRQLKRPAGSKIAAVVNSYGRRAVCAQ